MPLDGEEFELKYRPSSSSDKSWQSVKLPANKDFEQEITTAAPGTYEFEAIPVKRSLLLFGESTRSLQIPELKYEPQQMGAAESPKVNGSVPDYQKLFLYPSGTALAAAILLLLFFHPPKTAGGEKEAAHRHGALNSVMAQFEHQGVPRMRAMLRSYLIVLGVAFVAAPLLADEPLEAGFAAVDITPEVSKTAKPVWLAGYTAGRQATGIHDPLYARSVVLKHGDKKIALVSVDLIGLQLPVIKEIRKRLPDYAHITVASTHSHEGPDVIGIWGRTHFHRGVDDAYVEKVIDGVVESIGKAEKTLQPVTAKYGEAHDETLVGDSRLPKVKDDKLAVLQFTSVSSGKPAGLLVAWSCHPEAMGSKNKLVTADFPAATVATLEKRYGCPVAYFSTAVGGLMGPPDGRIFDANKVELKEGDWEYARILGEEVAALAVKAIESAKETSLAPFQVETQPIFVPVDNRLYRIARIAGVLQRAGFVWMNDFHVRGTHGADRSQGRHGGRIRSRLP